MFRVAGGSLRWRVAGERMRDRAKVQRWETEIHFQVSGLGSRVSGTGYQVRVRVRVLNLDLVLNT